MLPMTPTAAARTARAPCRPDQRLQNDCWYGSLHARQQRRFAGASGQGRQNKKQQKAQQAARVAWWRAEARD
jgi:hypothetical protein